VPKDAVVTRYEITFRVQVWAETPHDAVVLGIFHVACQEAPPNEVLQVLPTARMTGAPRTPEGPGWRCLLEVEESD
jgi:hypothetical protein